MDMRTLHVDLEYRITRYKSLYDLIYNYTCAHSADHITLHNTNVPICFPVQSPCHNQSIAHESATHTHLDIHVLVSASTRRPHRTPEMASWTEHWVAGSNPLGGHFHHYFHLIVRCVYLAQFNLK